VQHIVKATAVGVLFIKSLVLLKLSKTAEVKEIAEHLERVGAKELWKQSLLHSLHHELTHFSGSLSQLATRSEQKFRNWHHLLTVVSFANLLQQFNYVVWFAVCVNLLLALSMGLLTIY